MSGSLQAVPSGARAGPAFHTPEGDPGLDAAGALVASRAEILVASEGVWEGPLQPPHAQPRVSALPQVHWLCHPSRLPQDSGFCGGAPAP